MMWFRRRAAARRAEQAVLSLADLFEPILDELALAYDADAMSVGPLLRQHARALLTLDHAVVSPYATDIERMIARSEVDGTRAAVLAMAQSADDLRLGLTRGACMRLADYLTARAAETYLHTPEGTR